MNRSICYTHSNFSCNLQRNDDEATIEIRIQMVFGIQINVAICAGIPINIFPAQIHHTSQI